MSESKSEPNIRFFHLYLLWVTFCTSYLTLFTECNTNWSGCEGRIIDQDGNIFEDSSIDFSVVHIHLLNKQGYIQQSVSCAPNGYYSLPIEDVKRTYFLKINGPDGWHFSPPIYEVQGTCDQAKDFVFEGFSVVGKAISKYSGKGIEGIKLSLYQKDKLKSTIITQDDGDYTFSHILPGKVSIKASESEFHFVTDCIESQVMDNTLFVKDNFIIDGYPIEGQMIITEDEYYYPIWAANVIMYPSEETAPENICELKPSEVKEKINGARYTKTDMEGSFIFPQTLTGTYKIVTCGPSDKPKCTTSPSPYTFEVKDSPIKVEAPFQITSFNQVGIVITKNGDPLQGARITVDNNSVVTSGEEGYFYVPNTTPGFHSIEVNYPNIHFDGQSEMKFSYTFQDPIEILATAFDICGTVYQPSEDGHLVSENMPDEEAIISIRKPDGSKMAITTNKGSYCFKSEPGTYEVSVYVDPKRKWSYMTSPNTKTITITNSPHDHIDFHKKMFNLQVDVSSLEPSEALFNYTIAKFDEDTNNKSNPIKMSLASGGSYKLHPGKYELTIQYATWCFEKEQITFETGKDINIKVQFKQVGFKVQGSIDKGANVIVSDFTEPEGFRQLYKLDSGPFSLCMPHSSNYKLSPDNCFTFEKEYYTFTSSSQEDINIEVKKRLLTGSVAISQPFSQGEPPRPNFFIKAFDEQGEFLSSVKPQFNTETKKFDYQIWIQENVFFALKPTFAEVGVDAKFIPLNVSRSDMTSDCNGCLSSPNIQLRLGQNVYIKFGQLFEGESLVKIIDSNGTVAHQEVVKTNSKTVKLGPIFEDLHMPIKAHIEGYHLRSEEPTTFFATKISELKVIFSLDSSEENTSLDGASFFLTSLNDTQHKQKKIINSDHEVTFTDIPTDSYLLQPIFKEFAFDPPQQTISISEGENRVVNWSAKRVTYSCYGKVQPLFSSRFNPEEFYVEAKNEDYGFVDAPVNAQGLFALKGLTPNVDYIVSFVAYDPSKNEMQRFSPRSHIVNLKKKDQEDVIFHVIPKTTPRISGKLINIPLDDVITVELSKKGSNTPFVSQQLHLNNYFEFPGLSPNTYNLRVFKGQTSHKKSKKSLEVFYKEDIEFDGKNKFIEVQGPNNIPRDDKELYQPETNLKTSPMISIIILGFIFYYYMKSTDLDKVMVSWWNKNRSAIKKQK